MCGTAGGGRGRGWVGMGGGGVKADVSYRADTDSVTLADGRSEINVSSSPQFYRNFLSEIKLCFYFHLGCTSPSDVC